MDYDSLGRSLVDFYTKVLTYLRPHDIDNVQQLAANASAIAVQYAKDHPYHTAFTVVSVGLTPVLGAGWLTAPLLKIIGFGPLGPIASKEKKLFCRERTQLNRLIRYTHRQFGCLVPGDLAWRLYSGG